MEELHRALRVRLLASAKLYLNLHLLALREEALSLLKLAVKVSLANLKGQFNGLDDGVLSFLKSVVRTLRTIVSSGSFG